MHLDHKEWFIQAPWGRIAVIAWGDSTDEPVIYCHGKQDTAAGFHPLVQLLPRDRYYVGFDLPGNGLSDPFPRGLPISVFDFTFALKVLVDHFRWKQFVYIGHSLGTQIGKYYNFAYPDQMTRIVDLDPIPSYYTVTMDELPKWYYKFFFKYFDPENYAKLNGPVENSPTYTYDEAFELLKKNRNLTTETTKYVLDRNLAPAGDGKFRFAFDQRMKIVMRPPFSPEHTEGLYKSIEPPLLTVIARSTYDHFLNDPLSMDRVSYLLEKYRPGYFVEVVDGTHDVHISHPERVAPYVSKFLAADFSVVKSKLFTFDGRMKIVMRPPFTPEYTEKLYKSIKEPLLTVLAQGSINAGHFPPYVLDKTRPNYFVEVVEGTHDVHIYDAEKVAPFVNEFLTKELDSVKSKL